MRILMLSWEYPPRIVGGIARHVEELSEALAARGHDVHVVTANHPDTLEHECVRGVWIHRVKHLDFETPDFLSWVMQLNLGMMAYATALHTERPFEVIHAHDWLVAHAGVGLKRGLAVPMLATVHATEAGRNQGHIAGAFSGYVNQMEWWLCFEAWRVIVCSRHMYDEVQRCFGVPVDKLDVIPNGVDAGKFAPGLTADEARQFRRHLAADNQKIVFFVGRMVAEKGAQILLEAIPKVLPQFPTVRFVIAGKGGFLAELKHRAEVLGVTPYVNFTGFVSDTDLHRIYQVADVATFPSLYEPFGIVALEGMAAGLPTVVSDVGGLGEIVEHTVSGITTYAGNPDSLAWGLLEVLKNTDYAKHLARNGRQRVETIFNWARIAQATEGVYCRIVKPETESEEQAAKAQRAGNHRDASLDAPAISQQSTAKR